VQDPVLQMKTPPVRIDVVTVFAAGLSAIIVIGTLKVLAIRHKDHPLAQGYLVLF
jgi:hypothetical protein